MYQSVSALLRMLTVSWSSPCRRMHSSRVASTSTSALPDACCTLRTRILCANVSFWAMSKYVDDMALKMSEASRRFWACCSSSRSTYL